MAAAGIVNGYPDGTFKGQNDITRYEMAQMVAKAMANQDRANAEQQSMITRYLIYALQDNVGLTAYYGFNNKTNKSTGTNDKLSNYYCVDFNYQF